MSSSLLKMRVGVFLLPIVLSLPFAGKPYQADDHVFIWVAEQIAKSPLDFFGFEVDYGVEKVPIHMVNHNPPAVSYWLALIGLLTNWNIVALHLGMLLFAGLAALGIFELARDHDLPAGWAAALSVLTPAFLISSSTLMTDTPLLSCYVWAVVAWRRAFVQGSMRWMGVAVVCAALAPLIKFFGITLVPLLLADGLLRRPRPRFWWVWLLVPIAVFGAFQAYMYAQYGTTSITDAAGVALAEKWREGETSATRLLLTIVFLGGCLAPLAIPAAVSAGLRPAGVAGVFALTLSLPIMGGYSLAQLFIGESTPYSWSVLVHVAVFLFAGAVILIAVVRGLGVVPRNDAIVLGCWIAGTLVFTVFVNHYISARTLVPMLPALLILLLAGQEHSGPWKAACAVGFVLCAWLLIADDDVARHDRRAAHRAVNRAAADGAALHYAAYWGFEYHLMQAGARPLVFAEKRSFADPARPEMEPGGYLVVDAYAARAWLPVPAGFDTVEVIAERYRTRATTFDVNAAAGFYSHRIGVLPYRIGGVAPEEFLLLRWQPGF